MKTGLSKAATVIAAAAILLLGHSSAIAYQPASGEIIDARAATAVLRSGSSSASVYAASWDSFADWPPVTEGPEISTTTRICATISANKFDTGCATLPVVIDPQLGTARASGTITPTNCFYFYCPQGIITVDVTWVATSDTSPAVPGVPYWCFDPFSPLSICARSSATISRTANATGSLSSTYAGAVAGSDAAARIARSFSAYVQTFMG